MGRHADAPPGGRRPLRELEAVTRDALATIGDAAALAAWERALEAPACQRRARLKESMATYCGRTCSPPAVA